MLRTLRPYLTPGIALVGAGMIAVVPAAAPIPAAAGPLTEQYSVALTADPANDVTGMLTDWGLLPTITVNAVPLPAQINIELGSTLHTLLAMVGPFMTLSNAMNEINAALAANPGDAFSILFNAPGTLINAFLYGTAGIDVAGVNIPLFSGLLVSPFTAHVDLQLGQLVDLAGVGNTTLGDLLGDFGIGDESVQSLLTGMLDSLGFGHMSVTGLLDEFGIGDQPVAGLLSSLLDVMGIGNPTISGLADQLGLGDQTIASVLTGLLGEAGIGNPTLAGLLDLAGVGDLSIGDLATSLLQSAGMTDTSITGLLGQLGVGDLTIGDALKDLTHLLVGEDATVTDLLTQFGGADLTLGSMLIPLLESSGFGTQSLAELINELLGGFLGGGSASGMTVGDLVLELLQQTGYDMTLSEVLDSAQMSQLTLGELLASSPEMANTPFTDFLGPDGERTLLDLSNGAIPLPDVTCLLLPGLYNVSCYDTLNSLMGPNSLLETLQNLKSDGNPALGIAPGTPLTDMTLGQLLAATGQSGEHLSEILTGLNLSTPLDVVMADLGLDNVSLIDVLNNGFGGLMDTTLMSILSGVGLNNLDLDTVIDRLGLDVTINTLLSRIGLDQVDVGSLIDHVLGGMTLGSIANDLGLNDVHLDGFLESLLGGKTVGSLLDDLNLDSVPLDQILERLLGGITVNDIATTLGLDTVTLDSLIATLGLDGLTVNDVIDNLGLGGLDLDGLLSNMGIAGTDLISISIGQLGGLFGF